MLLPKFSRNHGDEKMSHTNIGFVILSLFCAGGLYAYLREVQRLRHLISTGTVAQGTVLKKEKMDKGSESVVHYLVSYEFVDYRGKKTVHEEDLNSWKFFSNVLVGDKIEILYDRDSPSNSYPLSQISADLRVSQWICAGILLLWSVTGAILIR
jgi:hypothetical protein